MMQEGEQDICGLTVINKINTAKSFGNVSVLGQRGSDKKRDKGQTPHIPYCGASA